MLKDVPRSVSEPRKPALPADAAPGRDLLDVNGLRAPAWVIFFFQAEDGIRDTSVTGVQTCALPISPRSLRADLGRLSRDGHLSVGKGAAFSRARQWRANLPLSGGTCWEGVSVLHLGVRLRDGCQLPVIAGGFLPRRLRCDSRA